MKLRKESLCFGTLYCEEIDFGIIDILNTDSVVSHEEFKQAEPKQNPSHQNFSLTVNTKNEMCK